MLLSAALYPYLQEVGGLAATLKDYLGDLDHVHHADANLMVGRFQEQVDYRISMQSLLEAIQQQKVRLSHGRKQPNDGIAHAIGLFQSLLRLDVTEDICDVHRDSVIKKFLIMNRIKDEDFERSVPNLMYHNAENHSLDLNSSVSELRKRFNAKVVKHFTAVCVGNNEVSTDHASIEDALKYFGLTKDKLPKSSEDWIELYPRLFTSKAKAVSWVDENTPNSSDELTSIFAIKASLSGKKKVPPAKRSAKSKVRPPFLRPSHRLQSMYDEMVKQKWPEQAKKLAIAETKRTGKPINFTRIFYGNAFGVHPNGNSWVNPYFKYTSK